MNTEKRKKEEAIPPEKFVELYQVISQRKKILQDKRKTDENYGMIKKIK